jgi:glyoxylate/hydroxypyruvate/2-ketogluconate reductase
MSGSEAKSRVVVTRRNFPEVIAELESVFSLDYNAEDTLWSPSELRARAANAQALYVVASDKVDQALLDAAPDLKMVATGSVGTNHIDLEACRARGIAVTNTPDVLSEATADMAWALLMAAARRVTESERWLRAGQWQRWAWDQFLGQDVFGATLGIIGMGRIGSAIARRARGFGMQIVYSNRSPAANEQELGARRVELSELLRSADYVMLVLPYSPASHHLIGASELATMKSGAVLINIARGGIVDDAALAQALKKGQIAAAGLDVFEGEPALHAGLAECSNIVMTPHIGSATRTSRVGMAMLAAQNLLAWQHGQALLTPVH